MIKSAKISLRKFELNDLPRILEIEQEIFPTDPWPEKNFKFCHKRYSDGFVVATFRDKLVGFAVGWFDKGKGGVGDIAMIQEYRRKGIGKLLVNSILTWLKKQKCEFCQIELKADNREALGFFQKLGFKKIKKLPKFYPSGEDAFLMTRAL